MRLVRPLDYAYLRELTPTAQRFYELAELQDLRDPAPAPRRTRPCGIATIACSRPSRASLTYDQVKKQMYKVHQPHLASALSGATSGMKPPPTPTARPDWLLHYTPGAESPRRICRLQAAVWR